MVLTASAGLQGWGLGGTGCLHGPLGRMQHVEACMGVGLEVCLTAWRDDGAIWCNEGVRACDRDAGCCMDRQ